MNNVHSIFCIMWKYPGSFKKTLKHTNTEHVSTAVNKDGGDHDACFAFLCSPIY